MGANKMAVNLYKQSFQEAKGAGDFTGLGTILLGFISAASSEDRRTESGLSNTTRIAEERLIKRASEIGATHVFGVEIRPAGGTDQYVFVISGDAYKFSGNTSTR